MAEGGWMDKVSLLYYGTNTEIGGRRGPTRTGKKRLLLPTLSFFCRPPILLSNASVALFFLRHDLSPYLGRGRCLLMLYWQKLPLSPSTPYMGAIVPPAV